MRRVPVGAWLLLTLAVATLVSTGAVAALDAGAAPSAGSAAEADLDRPTLSLHDRDYESATGDWTATANESTGNESVENESSAVDPEVAAARREAVADGERLVESCAATPPEDYAPPVGGDAVGWVNGYWYDEPLGVEDGDALDAQELHALTARTAARVEALRCLDFEALPPVRLANASELSARQTATFENRSASANRFDDARLEAGLLVGTEVDPVDVRVATTGTAVRGSYDPAAEAITLVGSDGDATRVDEATLAHELVHALQDQHLDLASLDARRTDRERAETALVEGDARLIEHRYERRCDDGQWTEPCLEADAPDGDAGSMAYSLLLSQPYNDGPQYVERRYDEGGWAAVNAQYDDPPSSAAEIVFPSSYDDYDAPFVRIDAAPAPEWERVRPHDAPANDVLGPAAIAAALLAPTFEGHPNPIYDPQALQRSNRQLDDSYRSYDYRLDAVEGWDGDRLIAYENDAGETGTLWASEWRTAEDAAEFRDHYEQLLEVRGARPVDGHRGTYRFREASDYDGAVYVASDDAGVVVVHGPDVDALQSLYAGAAPEPRGSVASSAARPGPSSELPAADEVPTLQIAGVLLALLLVGAAAFGWRRRS